MIWLSNYLANKPFDQVTKQDILGYLNSLKRSLSDCYAETSLVKKLYVYGTQIIIPYRRPIMRMRMVGVQKVRAILEILLPYLIAKKKQGQIVLEFCRQRMIRESEYQDYTQEQMKMLEELRFLNSRREKLQEYQQNTSIEKES